MALVVACFAEVASRFGQAGGPYLYTRVAFGRVAGIEMAWLTYLVRLTAAATNANLFVIYLAEFWPAATGRVYTPVVLAFMLFPLALANYRGVGAGLNVSSVFTVGKLVPLVIFIVAGGVWFLETGGKGSAGTLPPPADLHVWMEVVLLLVFAYGGFEAALVPLGEAKDPRRDAPIALFSALGTCALLYTLVQAVVTAALEDPGASPRPLAAAAAVTMGPAGTVLMVLGALLSVYGYLAGAALNVPRLTYAMAEQGDLPSRFGAVHPKFRSPHVSVVLFTALVWAFASAGGFLQNLTLSAVSRLFTYAAVCVALIVLRRRERSSPEVSPPWFRIPGGTVVALLGLSFSMILALRMSQREIAILAGTLLLGLLHWGLVRRRMS
jgi:amino acid transporter